MSLIYKGNDGNRRVNGRVLMHGEEITDPEEVKCLTGHPDFETKGGSVAKTPAAKKPKDKG